jgi:restriction system protein
MSAKPTTRPRRASRDLAASVPWWAWILAAIVVHAVLHLAADPPASGPLRFGDPSVWVEAGWLVPLANVAQYLLPALCIVAAVVLPRRRASPPGPAAVEPNAAPAIETLSWREFEPMVVQAFRLQGFHVNEATGGSDSAVDLLLRKERQTYLVHCKQWRAGRVGVETVQGVHAAMQARGAAGGMVLCAGRFSREAVHFAGGVNIRLIDGPALQALVRQAHAARPVPATATPLPATVTVTVTAPAQRAEPQPAQRAPQGAPSAPKRQPAAAPGELVLPCPLCGAEMVKRLAKRGVHAGQYFWGCSKHPACKGTRRLRPD